MLGHPLPDDILELLARFLHINDPYKYPEIAARNGKLWGMSVNYEAQYAPDILLIPNFYLAPTYQVARHVWPDRDPIDSHKTIEHWRKYPEYRDDVKLCWYGKDPEKVLAKVQESLKRGDANAATLILRLGELLT